MLLTFFLTLLVFAACSWLIRNTPMPIPHRVWPLPPESPRVQLVMSFGSPDDLGFPPSFWSRLSQILFGSAPQRMIRPYAVAVRGATTVVTDTKLGAVHLYEFEKKEYRQIGRGSKGLISPVGVAIDRWDRIWVADSVRAEVRVYRNNGKLEQTLHPFGRPTGLAYDEEHGLIWVADAVHHKLYRIEESSGKIEDHGKRGKEAGEYNFPVHLAFRGNRLYVTDTMNFRVQVLDEQGSPVSAFGRLGDGSGDFAMPKGIGVDGEGHVYVVDTVFDVFQVFDPKGTLLLGVGGSGPGPGEFSLPSGLTVDGRNRVWVADTFNSRIQVFQYLKEGEQPRGPHPETRSWLDWLIRPAFAVSDISSTLHNLSTGGPGTTKSTVIDEPCVFCHTPHNSQPKRPLWNRTDSGATYTPLYGSTTLNATMGQPAGSSKYCLACHDGTIGLGTMTNAPGGSGGATRDAAFETTFMAGRALIGTSLSDDHPVGFTYDAPLWGADPELKDPSTLTGVVLENGKVECGTCHEVHDDTNPPFLRVSSNNGAICTSCHDKVDWSTSSHSTSGAIWNGLGTDPWAERKAAWRQTTVAGNSCFNCHDPHSAATPTRLLKQAGGEENTCYPCHNGNVASKNVQGDFGKTYRHPVATYSGVHDPGEDPLTMAAHVECVDCHNPHAVDGSAPLAASPYGAPLGVGSRLKRVSGVDTNGTVVNPAIYLYQICYKCHGRAGDGHTSNFTSVVRRDATYNLRLKFDTANPSFHPVETAGTNANVPSLLPPWNTGSLISCIDCHNSDASPWVGGGGANGPHGSIYGPGLFIKQYKLVDNVANAWADFDMCLRCHSQASLNGGDSTPKHGHVLGCRKAPCMNCHDPHASTLFNHLINYLKIDRFGNTVISGPCGGYPEPTFADGGLYTGSCYIGCHGTNHCPKTY